MVYSDNVTFEQILQNLLSNVPDTVDKREGSVIYDALAPVAAELWKHYSELDVVMDETFADTASLQFLTLRANEKGVEVKEATNAVVSGSYTPTSITIAEGSRFNISDQNYIVTEEATGGTMRLQAESSGTGGNISSGQLLPIDYISGLQTAQITSIITAGEDADTAETLRERFFASVAAPFGGNNADYRRNVVGMLSDDGTEKAAGIRLFRGTGGSITLYVLAENGSGVFVTPSTEFVDKIQEEIDPGATGNGYGIAPIGHEVTIAKAEAQSLAVSAEVTFKHGHTAAMHQTEINEAVSVYFASLSESWGKLEDHDTSSKILVRLTGIEVAILSLEFVADVTNLKIDGTAANKTLSAVNKYPVLSGDVSVTEG